MLFQLKNYNFFKILNALIFIYSNSIFERRLKYNIEGVKKNSNFIHRQIYKIYKKKND